MGKPFYMWAHTSYMASSVRLPGVEFDHFKDHKRILPGFFIEMTIPSVEELRESPDQGGAAPAAAGGGPGLTRRESADCYATLSPTPSKAIGSAEDEDTCGYSLATPSLLTGLTTGPSVREDYVPRGGGGAAPDRGASVGDEGPSSDDDDDGEGEEEEEEEEEDGEGDGALFGDITCTDLRSALDACVAADAPPASGAGPEPKPA